MSTSKKKNMRAHDSLYSKRSRVSSSRNLGREQKRLVKGERRGEKETLIPLLPSLSPPPSPPNFFFFWGGGGSRSNFRAITQLETYAV